MTAEMKRRAELKHARYEADMLQATFETLELGFLRNDMLNNALIESFAVHARNLDEFFLSSGWHSDTLKASCYVDGDFAAAPRSVGWEDLIKKVHKQITHLTEDRIGADFIGSDDRRTLFGVLAADIASFSARVKDEYRGASWPRDASLSDELARIKHLLDAAPFDPSRPTVQNTPGSFSRRS